MPAYDKDIVLTVGLEPEGVVATARELNEKVEKIFESANGNKTSASFKSLQIQMDKVNQKSIEIQNILNALANKPIPTTAFDNLNQEIARTEAELDKLSYRLANLSTKKSGKHTQVYDDIKQEIDVLTESLNKLNEERAKLIESGDAFYLGKDSEMYAENIKQLNELNNKLVLYSQRASEAGNVNVSGPTEGFKKLASAILNVNKAINLMALKAFISTLTQLSSVIKNVASWAKKAAASMLKLIGGTIVSGLKKLASGITSLNKAGNSNNNIFKNGFRTFLRYGLGMRSLFTLIRKLRSALIKGFEDLAQVNEPFNQAMSEMLTALTYLRNSFATAFAPIIETVSPILTEFINKMAEAVSQVGMLISSLTGKEFIRAIPVYQDYADSVKNTSDGTKEAAKNTKKQNEEAKKLKRTLAGFDDVEILKDNDNDDDDEETSEAAFITAPISSALSNLANSLLDAWKNADFSQLGRLVGEKLLAALNKIPWDKIKNVLRKVAKSIATFLNGFLETPGLFTAIGKTIAEALNSAFEFVESFVSNFHWDSLGKAIKDAILGVINNIDWELIYKTLRELGTGIGTALENAFNNPEIWSGIFITLSNLLNSIINGLNAFITSVNWGSIAANIANGLNDGIKNFDWKTLADTLINIINSIFDAWYNFITTFDFAEFGKRIGQTISDVIHGIDWGLGGMNVGLTINKLFEALDNAIRNINWVELGESIKTFILNALTSINWNTIYQTMTDVGTAIGTTLQTALNDPQIWTEALTAIARGFNAIVYSIRAFIQSIEWAELGNNIATGINNMVSTVDWDAVADTLVSGINGAIDFFVNAVTTIEFHEIGEHIGSTVSKVITGVNWKEGAYSIGLCATKLYDAINGAMETIVWEDVGKAIADAIAGYFDGLDWNTLGKFASNCLHALLSTLTSAIEEIDWINVANEVGKKIGDFLVGFDWEQAAHDTMELLGAALTAAILIVTGLGKAVADWIIQGLTDMWDFFGTKIDDAGGDIGRGILNGIADIFKNIGGWLVENIVNPIVEGLASTIDIRSLVRNMFGIELPMIEDYSDALERLASVSKDAGDPTAWSQLNTALEDLHKNGKLSDEAFNGLSNRMEILRGYGIPFEQVMSDVATSLSNNEVNANDLDAALQRIPSHTNEVIDVFGDLGDKSDTTSDKTSAVGDTLGAFDDLSIVTPLKLLLISTAIKNMGEKGELSDEQVADLQKTLDEYDTDDPKKELDKLTDKFENTGASAEQLESALNSAVDEINEKYSTDLPKIVTTVQTTGKELKTEGSTAADNLADGMVNEMKARESDINKQSTKLIKTDVLDAIDTAADSHSPSRQMKLRGEYLTQGLLQGMQTLESSLQNLVSKAITNILSYLNNKQFEFQTAGANSMNAIVQGMTNNVGRVSEVINRMVNSISQTINSVNWSSFGYNIINEIQNGLSNGVNNASYSIQYFVNSIRDEINLTNWYGLGQNIGIGIFNGLAGMEGSLNILAHNLAVGMYNSMTDALSIASPSKKFAWIGKMTMLGLEEGIEDNQSFVTDTLAEAVENIEKEADGLTATINLDANMETMLGDFSDTVVDQFSRLITNLQALTQMNLDSIPPITQGKVVPYASTVESGRYDATMENLLNELDYINAHQITPDEIGDVLENAFRQYLNISFYMGDEQVARHANAGNLKLGRRYNTL